jgi:hypothetical protein
VNFLLSIANNFYQSERRKIKLANKKRWKPCSHLME